MEIINIINGDIEKKAIYFMELPQGEELQKLVNVLQDCDGESKELFTSVTPGSVPDKMGADHTLFLALEKLPKGGFGEGGVYGVMNWMSDTLDEAMPDGMGAALTQPGIFTKKNIKTDKPVYLAVISPMDRTKTDKIAMLI